MSTATIIPTVSQPINQCSEQLAFDNEYVTSSEIMKTLDISRAAFLHGRRSGKLPSPIVLNDGRLFVWKRRVVEPMLPAWKEAIRLRKSA
jgi:hypothetical protein